MVRSGRRVTTAVRARGTMWAARLIVALQVLCVIVPLSVIAVWAFVDSWPASGLLPSGLSLRGLDQVLSGRQGAGLATLLQSIGIAVATAIVSTVVAVLAARAVADYTWKGRHLFRFATVLPFLIPTTVFAMGVQVAFIRMGIARTVPGVVLAHSIVALPYSVAIMTDVVRAAGTKREDAARSLGADRVKTILLITIPSLMPGLLSSLSMAYIVSFSQYFLTLLIGGGAVQTYAVVMFPYFSGGDRTIASAYGLAFIIVTFAVFAIFEVLLKRVGVEEDAELFTL